MSAVTEKLVEADTGPPPAVRYDSFSLFLHWATAALVVSLWILGQIIDDFPRGAPRVTVRSIHIALGVVLAAIIVIRIAWRMSSQRRAPPAAPGVLGRSAEAVHYGLYALVVLTIAAGFFNVWVRGDSIFGLFSIPKFSPGNGALKESVEELHEWFANTVLIVAGLHSAAALFHRYVLRDEVLQRMLPARCTRAGQRAEINDRHIGSPGA